MPGFENAVSPSIMRQKIIRKKEYRNAPTEISRAARPKNKTKNTSKTINDQKNPFVPQTQCTVPHALGIHNDGKAKQSIDNMYRLAGVTMVEMLDTFQCPPEGISMSRRETTNPFK